MNRKEKKNKKRGLITFLILVVLVVLGVLAVYYQYMKKLQLQDTVHTPTTETEKLVAKDMDAGYPETPKEVIKLFGRINQCIYNKKLSKGSSLLRKFILHLYQVLLLIEIGDA